MIKSASIDEMINLKWHYLTAITKPQVEQLMKQNIIQLSLFEEKLIEIQHDDIRYLLRKNPVRSEETANSRASKIEKVKQLAEQKTGYLKGHSKASAAKALEAVSKKAEQLKVSGLLQIKVSKRVISVTKIESQIVQAAQLDGCYVLKSNVPQNVADKEQLHKQYKDLALVEMAFRTMKQSFEEMQPIYVRKEKRTRGHVFVCMLAYMVMKYIWDECKDLGCSQAAIYDNLNDIHFLQCLVEEKKIKKMPDVLNETQTTIIQKLNIKLPKYL